MDRASLFHTINNKDDYMKLKQQLKNKDIEKGKNIFKKDYFKFYIQIPKSIFYDYPRSLIYYFKILLTVNWDEVITTISLKNSEKVIENELKSKAHVWLNVKNKYVIDLGAFNGDTAIYYALHGAKEVDAYEARDELIDVANKMIKKYGLDKKIRIHHMFVTSKQFNELSKKVTDAALKVDIEGGERELFRNATSEALGKFSLIHVEYHYGYLDILKRLEKEGFKVKYTKPSYVFKEFGKKPMITGDIYAYK